MSNLARLEQITNELHMLEDSFKTLVEHLPDLVCVATTGPDYGFKYVNRAWIKELGFDRGYYLNTSYLDMVHPYDYDRTKEATDNFGNVQWPFYNRYMCDDGGYKWLMWNANNYEVAGLVYAIAKVCDGPKAEWVE